MSTATAAKRTKVLDDVCSRIEQVKAYLKELEETRETFLRLATLDEPEIKFYKVVLEKLEAVLPLAESNDLTWIDRLKSEGDQIFAEYQREKLLFECNYKQAYQSPR